VGIVREHIELHREVLAIPGFVADPFLMIGFQVIRGDGLPRDFAYPSLKELLQARGLEQVTALDHFDPAADLRYDLNLPVPEHEHERYRTVYDVGTIEHVFDTRQCFESCARMVAVGGHYFIHTPVKGYFGHGLHTFSPRILVEALKANGFEIVYRQFCSKRGERLHAAGEADDTLLWVVGRKTTSIRELRVPQQERWEERYGEDSTTSKGES
jgi:hypothetical protein